jgi:hypothetical protein
MSDILGNSENLIEEAIHEVAADFHLSFGELLFTASLLERRPCPDTIHPEANQSLKAAGWHLLTAITKLDHVLVALTATGATPSAKARIQTLPRIISRAIERKILVRLPSAERLVAELPADHSLNDIVSLIKRELIACREALDRIDLNSSGLSMQLHSALSVFTDAMVKGQYVAILRLDRVNARQQQHSST